MNRHIFGASVVVVLACAAGAASAHGRVQWSVTMDSQPRGAVIVPQSQFSYGAPPSVYTPPPPVFVPPPVIVAPPPVIYVQPPYPGYVNPPPVHRHDWNDRRDWNDRGYWNDRRDWNDRRNWNDGRPGQWGYGYNPGQRQFRR